MQGETFFTYCKDNGAEEDEDDELSLAAYSCLEAVLTVLEGVQARPEVYELLEPVLCSVRVFAGRDWSSMRADADPLRAPMRLRWNAVAQVVGVCRCRWWSACWILRASSWSILRTP